MLTLIFKKKNHDESSRHTWWYRKNLNASRFCTAKAATGLGGAVFLGYSKLGRPETSNVNGQKPLTINSTT